MRVIIITNENISLLSSSLLHTPPFIPHAYNKFVNMPHYNNNSYVTSIEGISCFVFILLLYFFSKIIKPFINFVRFGENYYFSMQKEKFIRFIQNMGLYVLVHVYEFTYVKL